MIPNSNRHPSSDNRAPDKPLFPIGQLVATPGALDLFKRLELSPFDFVSRHRQGDWGDIDIEDWQSNDEAINQRLRLFSSYQITPAQKLWIITEADRSVTTLLLPEEY